MSSTSASSVKLVMPCSSLLGAHSNFRSGSFAFSCGPVRQVHPCSHLCLSSRHFANVVAFAKSSKRLKYSHSSDKHIRGEPLFIVVDPDGSDLWRLDRVTEMLKSGAVSKCTQDGASAFLCVLVAVC